MKRPNQIALTLPPEQRDLLESLRSATGRTVSEMIREAVGKWLSDRMATCAHCGQRRLIAGYGRGFDEPLCGECF